MGAIAEEYGYADGGECISVCDPNEAWIFEIAGAGPLWRQGSGTPGAAWAAVRVPDNGVYAGANRSLIGELDLSDPDNYMAGTGIYSVAESLGFWDPDAGKTFRYWEVYGPEECFYNSRREWRVRDLVAPSLELDPYARRYPFTVVPDEKVSVADLMAIQRDYYEGTEFDLTKGLSAGPFGTPDRYSTPRSQRPEGQGRVWERAIAMFRCSYTIVTQSRAWLPDPIGGVLWFGPDAPHGTIYMPIYCGVTSLPECLMINDRRDFSRDSAWWAFDFVQNWANLAWSFMIVDIREHQQKHESEFFAMQPAIESAAVQLHDVDPALAVTFLTNYTADVVNRTVEAQWEFADMLVAKYNDGYSEFGRGSKGYPQEWLDAVGAGVNPDSTLLLSNYKDIWYGEWEPED
jgi:dipeptidase